MSTVFAKITYRESSRVSRLYPRFLRESSVNSHLGGTVEYPKGKRNPRYHRKTRKDRAKKTSEAGKTLSSFARGKLQKMGEKFIEWKREAGNDLRKRLFSGQNGRIGISASLFSMTVGTLKTWKYKIYQERVSTTCIQAHRYSPRKKSEDLAENFGKALWKVHELVQSFAFKFQIVPLSTHCLAVPTGLQVHSLIVKNMRKECCAYPG